MWTLLLLRYPKLTLLPPSLLNSTAMPPLLLRPPTEMKYG